MTVGFDTAVYEAAAPRLRMTATRVAEIYTAWRRHAAPEADSQVIDPWKATAGDLRVAVLAVLAVTEVVFDEALRQVHAGHP